MDKGRRAKIKTINLGHLRDSASQSSELDLRSCGIEPHVGFLAWLRACFSLSAAPHACALFLSNK